MSATPGAHPSGFQRAALASDKHTHTHTLWNLAREWKHTSGKHQCHGDAGDLVKSHARACLCGTFFNAHVCVVLALRPYCGCKMSAVSINYVCVWERDIKRKRIVRHLHTHSKSDIPHTCRIPDWTQATHTFFIPYMCVCVCVRACGVSADGLAVAVKLAPFSPRCQVFVLAARGAESPSQGCQVAADGKLAC